MASNIAVFAYKASSNWENKMAALDELIDKIEDKELRKRILEETNKLRNQRKFGLVFEDHIPECTPLYGVEIKKGGSVALKNGQINDVFDVLSIDGENVYCKNRKTGIATYKDISELVAVAEFGDPIYPYLQKIDSICNAPDSDLWHTLIEADNYHALQLLEYLYAGKVDCIYIDPPYNTGARDWKYNNDYVDSSDAYRHSKWLSFMKKRMALAKKLLNSEDSVLIVTIDEKEYLHLGCLLEQMFPEAKIQMVSSVVNPTSVARSNEFNRNNEFLFFVMIGNYHITPIEESVFSKNTNGKVRWRGFRRTNAANTRDKTNTQFYPIFVNSLNNKIEKVGDPLPRSVDINTIQDIPGCTTVFPIKDDGTEMMWGVSANECRDRLSKGYIRASKATYNKPQKYLIEYLTSGTISDIDCGRVVIKGYKTDGSAIAENVSTVKVLPKTQWDYRSHGAREYGTKYLTEIFHDKRFQFPKSLYAVHDCLRFFVSDKPKALIIDFFGGSGTTLHAVNLLNAEDGGNRRCIMVTNNEVSDAEAKALTKQGYNPGDEEWEKLGIARYVTWPRTVCSIEGHDINGTPLKGNYLGLDGQKETGQPMANGFKANCVYFKLGFLDKNAVSLGRQLCELVPLLWMKAGAIGECPEINRSQVSQMLFFPKNKMGILVKESYYSKFIQELDKYPEIQTIFIVTDSDDSYREMVKPLRGKTTYQLYRDYLDNFKINGGNL